MCRCVCVLAGMYANSMCMCVHMSVSTHVRDHIVCTFHTHASHGTFSAAPISVIGCVCIKLHSIPTHASTYIHTDACAHTTVSDSMSISSHAFTVHRVIPCTHCKVRVLSSGEGRGREFPSQTLQLPTPKNTKCIANCYREGPT